MNDEKKHTANRDHKCGFMLIWVDSSKFDKIPQNLIRIANEYRQMSIMRSFGAIFTAKKQKSKSDAGLKSR